LKRARLKSGTIPTSELLANAVFSMAQPITVAMVISDKCRKGFSTCDGMVPPMFDTIEEALAFVEPYARGYLDKLMADTE
jgi:hypothetical protein